MCICMSICLRVRGYVYSVYTHKIYSVCFFNLSILIFFRVNAFSLFSHLSFSLRRFCPFCIIPAIADAIHISLQE